MREYESLVSRYDGKLFYEDPLSQAPVSPIMAQIPSSWFDGELGRVLARKHDARNMCNDYIRTVPDAPGSWGIILNLHYAYNVACDLEHKMCEMILFNDPDYKFPADVTNWPYRKAEHKEFDEWFATRKTEPVWPKIRPDLKRQSHSSSTPAAPTPSPSAAVSDKKPTTFVLKKRLKKGTKKQ